MLQNNCALNALYRKMPHSVAKDARKCATGVRNCETAAVTDRAMLVCHSLESSES